MEQEVWPSKPMVAYASQLSTMLYPACDLPKVRPGSEDKVLGYTSLWPLDFGGSLKDRRQKEKCWTFRQGCVTSTHSEGQYFFCRKPKGLSGTKLAAPFLEAGVGGGAWE